MRKLKAKSTVDWAEELVEGLAENSARAMAEQKVVDEEEASGEGPVMEAVEEMAVGTAEETGVDYGEEAAKAKAMEEED